MSPLTVLLTAIVYVLIARMLVWSRIFWRDFTFAALNLGVIYYLFFWSRDFRFRTLFTGFFVLYLAMVCIQYIALHLWAEREGKWPWLAFFTPILFLIIVRYAPVLTLSRHTSRSIYEVLLRHPEFNLNWVLIGISYLTFRASYLVLEVRNRVVPRPGFWRYLGFCFFAPTLSVGPISPYALHESGFAADQRSFLPIGRSLLRVIVGAVKFRFFGPILNTLTYSGLLLDGHPHHWIDLPMAAIVYYLYLYCNFSGFCDIAIGGAGLIGIPVAENFDNPFAARNMREFWNRWHITLSVYMRDVVFAPMSKVLVRRLGPAYANHAIAFAIFVVFVLIGVWHGTGWNYLAFGVTNAIGVMGVHYYSVALKKRLGKQKFLAYNSNVSIRAAGMVVTFCYFTFTLFFFANDGAAMKQIFEMLRY
jgi:membrane protein involved in D-alanine export